MGHIETAVGMFNAGEVLREYSLNYRIGTADEKARRNSTVIPMVVVYIFGIEVGINALIEKQGQSPPWTHDLEELYGKLIDSVRARIEQKASTSGISAPVLEKLLAYHKNSFEEWRYRGDSGGTLAVQPDTVAATLRAIIEVHKYTGQVSEQQQHIRAPQKASLLR